MKTHRWIHLGAVTGVLAFGSVATPNARHLAAADAQPSGRTLDERVTRTFEVGANGQVDLSNVTGSVIVRGVPGSTITIDATKHASANGDAREALDGLVLDFSQRGDRIVVSVRHERGSRRRRAWVDFTVTVPTSAGVTVGSVSGDVEARDVGGELSVEVVSGDVDIVNAGQLARAKSVSGRVRIDTARAERTAIIGSVSGDVFASGLHADRLEVETVSGELELRDTTCSRLEVSTVSGDVEFQGPMQADGRYEFRSHSGDVTIVLSGDTGFDLTGDTYSGSFEFDMPVTLLGNRSDRDDRDRDRSNRNGSERGRSVRGTYGDGSARLEIATFSGDVSIRRN